MEPSLLDLAGRQASDIARARAFFRSGGRDLGRVQLNCPAHGVYMSAGVSSATMQREVWSPCPSCVDALHELQQRQRAEAEQRRREYEIAERIERADIPLRFAGMTFGDYVAETDGQRKAFAIAKDFGDRFVMHRDRGDWLVFAGRPGNGKTMLATSVLQQVCRQGFTGRYTTCAEMVQAVRATWGRDGEGREADVISAFCEVDLLVVDEIGSQTASESVQSILHEVLCGRYGSMRPTILASNLGKDGLAEFLGDRIWDRLTECGRWCSFTWASYRPQARREMAE